MDAFKKALRVLFTISSLISVVFLWLNRDMFMSLLGVARPGTVAAGISPGTPADPNAALGQLPQGADGAVKLAAMISAAVPNSLQAQMAAGAIFLRQDKYNEAMGAFRKAKEIDPLNASARFQIGMILMKHEKTSEAEAELREAIKLDPKHTDSMFALASILQKTSTLDEPIALYKKISELKPDNAEAHNNLGIVYDAQGSKDKAMAEFKRALELSPGDAVIQRNLQELTAELAQRMPPPAPPSTPEPAPEPDPAPSDDEASAQAPVLTEPENTPPATKGPESLVLTNGRTVKGTIVEKTEDGVWLEFGSGRIFFANSEISEINP